MTRPAQSKRSWLAGPDVVVSVPTAMAELEAWCLAEQGRTIVYSVDNAVRPPEYCVMVDDGDRCVSNRPAPTASGAWSIAVAAVREWERNKQEARR